MTNIATPNNASPTLNFADGLGNTAAGGNVTFGGAQVSQNGAGAVTVQTITPVRVSWTASDPKGVIYTAPVGGAMVLDCVGFLAIAQGATSAVQPVIVSPGTTYTSGATLTTAAFNNNGTVNQNQTLTLIASPTLAAGQSIGMVTSGTLTVGAGCLTMHIQESGE